MIRLYGFNTPNSHKISIALEELQLPYTVEPVDVRSGAQLSDEFGQVNPNRKIPVIVDTDTNTTVFESCAILLYLASKAERLMPRTPKERWDALQWLFFQAASVGPMFGQLAWFTYYAGEPVPYALERYGREVQRLFGVLDERLRGRDYLCDEYSIVDIAHFGWLHCVHKMHLGFEGHKNLLRWYDRVASRPAVIRGLEVPSALPTWDARTKLGSGEQP